MEEIQDLLRSVMNSDNSIRVAAENKLSRHLKKSTGELMHALIQVASAPKDPEWLRLLAAVTLKRFMKKKLKATTRWEKVDSALSGKIRAELLGLVRSEGGNMKIFRQLLHSLGLVAAKVLEDGTWPELDAFVNEFVVSDMGEEKFAAMMWVLPKLTNLLSDRKVAGMQEVFAKGFASDSNEVLVETGVAYCKLIVNLDPGESKPYINLFPELIDIIKTLSESCKDDEEDEERLSRLLKELDKTFPNICEFAAKNFKSFWEVLVGLDRSHPFLNGDALECAVRLLAAHPEHAKKHKKELAATCDAILDYMVTTTESTVSQEWLHPDEQYDDTGEGGDEDEHGPVQNGSSMFDLLLEPLDKNLVFSDIERVVQFSMSKEDWRYHVAGLDIISRLGEYCEEEGTTRLQKVIPVLVPSLAHPHPKVCHKAFYAIAILSQDMSPEFQSDFFADLAPPMMARIDDPLPRIQSYACASLANFIEGADKEEVGKVFPQLVPRLFNQIRVGCLMVKVSAVICIMGLVSNLEDGFAPQYKETFAFLFEQFHCFSEKKYRLFRAHVLECVSVMFQGLWKTQRPLLKDDLPLLLEHMMSLQDSGDCDPLRNIRFLVFNNWIRVASIAGKKLLVPHLPRIMAGVFRAMATIPALFPNGLSVDKLRVEPYETAFVDLKVPKRNRLRIDISEKESDDASSAMKMLNMFADTFEESFMPYAIAAENLAMPFIINHDDSLMCKSMRLLPHILKAAKGLSREKLLAVANRYMGVLQSVESNDSRDAESKTRLKCLAAVLETCGYFLDQKRVDEIMSCVSAGFDEGEALLDSEAINSDSDSEEENEDQDMGKVLTGGKRAAVDHEEEEDAEDNTESVPSRKDVDEIEDAPGRKIMRAAASLLTAVLKTHPDESLHGMLILYSQVITHYMRGEIHQQQLALCTIDDMIEYCGARLILPVVWSHCAECILKFAVHKNYALRQAACYGVGCLAKSGGPAFVPLTVRALTTLAAAMEMKKDKSPEAKLCEGSWHMARDNAISAIGKILKFQPAAVSMFADVWAKWLRYLPIKKDNVETDFTQTFLAETVMERPEVAMGGVEFGLMGEVVRALVQGFDVDDIVLETKKKTKEALIWLAGDRRTKKKFAEVLEEMKRSTKALATATRAEIILAKSLDGEENE